MAVKFKITGERFAEACNIAEYMAVASGNKDIIVRIAPRFILDDEGNYIVNVVTDSDGDIEKFEGIPEAFIKMAKVTPKKIDYLVSSFQEAIKQIVNPPSAGV